MRFLLILIINIGISLQALADDKTLYIYQDADNSHHIESSKAIQMGMELAFEEIGNEINGYKIDFKYLDHRGNVVRSKRNFQTYIDDPKGLAIYSGIHSPPLIKNRAFINENNALTLVPWAAGGPITRYPAKENWVFRLSIDDTQAGDVIVDYAMTAQKCEKPNLLLEDTPWGDSNVNSMSNALLRYDIKLPDTTRFNWNIKQKGARALLRGIIANDNDCIIFVGNAIEGEVIIQEIVNLQAGERLPVISHWGITGGNFHESIPHSHRKNIDLNFIQTCFAFTSAHQSDYALNVFERLKKKSNGAISKPSDLKSAVGFVHAYDLTKLLISAIEEVGLTGDMNQDRENIRIALENIKTPVTGLVKTYNRPFSTFDIDKNRNAHEALDATDYCMGWYGPDDEIMIAPL